MLSTEEAAALLAERGVLVKGRGTEPHSPTARTVEAWCRTGKLECTFTGKGKRKTWFIDRAALDAFTPPEMGTKRRKSKTLYDTLQDADLL